MSGRKIWPTSFENPIVTIPRFAAYLRGIVT